MRKPKVKLDGCKIYAVGGCVRDTLLGLESNDIDYLIVGGNQQIMNSSNLKQVGKDFPVYLDEDGFEYALARTERKTGFGYNNFTTETDGVTLEEDLKRRDLTINSICFDFERNEIIDPLNGKDDLQNKILRMSNPKSFIEDPLRIIRLARFNSRFPDFTIDPLTKETILNMSNKKIELENISAERINLEFEKMWKQSTDPSKFFYILRDLGILEIISQEIYNLIYIKENLYHHPEGNTFEHVMIALRKAKELKLDVNSMWMIITHDFGKIMTKDGPKHTNHENDGIPIVESFCKRMRLTDFQTNLCRLFCEQHMRISKIKEMKSFKIATLFDICKVDHTDKIIKYLAMCSVIDKIGRDKECSWPFTMEEIDSYISAYRSVSGKDVIKLFNSHEQDIPQGKEFSHQLNILRGLEISKNRRKI